MRVPAECPRCREIDERRRSIHEVGSEKREQRRNELFLDEYEWAASDVPCADVHSGKLTFRCEQGHTTVVTLPIPDFELLFEFGCSALLDGYPREAITAFASSHERFLEFACRFLLARANVSFQGIDAWWNDVKKQSERQLGSFIALWTANFPSPPPLLAQNLVELRNDCVHKGRIPPEDKAKSYGEGVLRAVVGGVVTLRNSLDSEGEYHEFVESRVLRLKDDEPDMAVSFETFVLRLICSIGEIDLDSFANNGTYVTRTKNPTNASTLTIDRALSSFAEARSLGLRRK